MGGVMSFDEAVDRITGMPKKGVCVRPITPRQWRGWPGFQYGEVVPWGNTWAYYRGMWRPIVNPPVVAIDDLRLRREMG